MRHPSGVVLNLLGPSTKNDGVNILMDVQDKHPGYTHIAWRVDSLENARKVLAEQGIEITGGFSFKDMTAIFFRDPDRNVIELDEYAGEEPETRADPESDFSGYSSHP
jgi:catechol 2,3-dioxygenase-like lactoylglutathione lyase family enzyme